jgi:hypothetical protein
LNPETIGDIKWLYQLKTTQKKGPTCNRVEAVEHMGQMIIEAKYSREASYPKNGCGAFSLSHSLCCLWIRVESFLRGAFKNSENYCFSNS